jgi:hypothetical protein
MYTSGRTVKSAKRQPTTIAKATMQAHRLMRRHLDMAAIGDLATVQSTRTADPRTLAEQIRTRITFPANTDSVALTDALGDLDNVVSVTAYPYGITVLRSV